jgi:alginate O-acetyltransferase complex protein AlgI
MGLTFTSVEFILFLGICLGLVHAVGRLQVRMCLLIIFSFFFCLTFGFAGALVVTFTAIANFFVGNRLGASINDAVRKRWLWAGLTANLVPLVFLKYSGFLLEMLAPLFRPFGAFFSAPSSLLFPVIGLSYFTFAGMSYVLDIYWEKMEPSRKFSEFLCYLVYFPKLVAGPIVRACDFLPQLGQGFKITAQDFEVGIGYLLVGAAKKLVIADQLASHVSTIMTSPEHYNAWTLLQGMIGYTVQIYADFSGYSDMAIGCARLMGVKFPQNFRMPYSSVNIAEFWRRWHITMSSWFRDYVFTPLEFAGRSAPNANVRSSRNIIITMLLCGLWHGPSWNFVMWGGLHGVGLATYQFYNSFRSPRMQQPKRSLLHPGVLVSRALTLSFVMICWVFFGTQTLSAAFGYLWRMATWSADGVSLDSPYILPLAALVFLAHLVINKDRNLVEELPKCSQPVRVLTYASLLLALACLVPADAVPFVYVRF